MLRLSLTNAKQGMVLAMPVFHPSLPGHVLLRPGFSLDEPAMKRLRELRVGQLWIRYPALEDVVRFINPDLTLEHAQMCSLVGRTMEKLLDPKFTELDFKVFAEAVRSLLTKLREANSSTLLVTDLTGAESPLSMHSGTVCFLSLLMGLKLQEYVVEQRPKVAATSARNVENLGVAAMLHDVGMLRISPEAAERWKRTGDELDPEYQRHVQIGYQMLRGKVEPTAAATVLHHHQAYDGTGWPVPKREREMEFVAEEAELVPRGLAGEQIHIFARILAIADIYDTLRNPPAGEYREEARVPAVRVLKAMLLMARSRHIDPIAFKGLLSVVPAFLPGTIVRLTNGVWAVVTDFDPLHPCRPAVRVLRRNPEKSVIEDEDLGPTLLLSQRKDIRVAFAEGHDVSGDTFDAMEPTEFDIRVMRLPRPRRLQRAA